MEKHGYIWDTMGGTPRQMGIDGFFHSFTSKIKFLKIDYLFPTPSRIAAIILCQCQ